MVKKLGKFKQLILGVIIGAILFSGTSAFAAYGTNITAYFQPLKYFVDGQQKYPPAGHEGFIYKNTTYVPLRFVAQSLGQEVTWDQQTKTIHMESGSSNPQPVNSPSPSHSDNSHLFGDIHLGMTKSEVKADESKYSGQLLEETSSTLIYYSSYPIQDTSWETAIQYIFEGGRLVEVYVVLDGMDYLTSYELERLFFALEQDIESVYGTSDYYDYNWYDDEAGLYSLYSLWQGDINTPSIFVNAEQTGSGNMAGVLFSKQVDYNVASASKQDTMTNRFERLQKKISEKDIQAIGEKARR